MTYATGPVSDTNPSHLRLMYEFPSPQSQFPVPAIPDVPEDVRHSSNVIVRMMVEALCKNATLSRTSCYYFNMTAANGFAGDDWLKGVYFATLLAWHLFVERRAQGAIPENCQREAAGTVLAIKMAEAAGANALLYQQLSGQEQLEVQQLINLGQRYRQVLNTFVENITRANSVTRGIGGVVGEVLSGNSMGVSYNTTGATQATYNDAPRIDMSAPVVSGTKIDMTYASRLLGIEPEPVQVQDLGFGSSFSSGAAVSHQPTVIQLGETATINEIDAQPKLGLTEADWKPSIADPFKAFTMGKDLTVEYIEHEGFVLSVPMFKGEDEMNREELAIPNMCTAMQSAIADPAKEEPLAIVNAGMDLVVAGIRNVGSGEAPEHAAEMAALGMDIDSEGVQFKDIGYAYSMNHAISLARAAAIAQASSEKAVFCTSGVMIEESAIQPKNDATSIDGVVKVFSEAITGVNSCGSYQALAALIASMTDGQTDIATISTAISLNKFVTTRFNDMVKTKVGIFGFIDSFMDDVDQFIRDISTAYGTPYRDALLQNAGDFIASIADGLTISTIPEPDSEVEIGQALEMGYNYTLTLVRVVSSYLFDNLQVGETRTIHESVLPGLHAFFQSIDKTMPGNIHLVTTIDGVTFKVVKSIVGSESFTITKV